MNTYGRRQSLLDLLSKQSSLRVPELAKALDISEGTVRNDLNALQSQGRLTRVHGGAILIETDQFQNNSFKYRSQSNSAAKIAIAREAAELVKDGDSILLDASSTIYFLARVLSKRSKLRVVTNGFEVARELAQDSSNNVFLIGGIVNNDSSSVTGLLSERILEELRIQKAFLSCSGFSLERGLTEVHFAEAQIKRKAIESSQQLYALVDSSKFGQEDLTSFLRTEEITRLFTDTHLAPEWIEKLKMTGINFTLCEEERIPT